jgi:hypothetical protein
MGRTIYSGIRDNTLWIGVYIDTSDEDTGYEYYMDIERWKIKRVNTVQGYMKKIYKLKKVKYMENHEEKSIFEIIDFDPGCIKYFKSRSKRYHEKNNKLINKALKEMENIEQELYVKKNKKYAYKNVKIDLPKYLINKINKKYEEFKKN